MVGIKEIKNKIKSVRSTQKITKAMEMVAASKMKRTQQKMVSIRPFIFNIKAVVKNAVTGNLEYKHAYTIVRHIGVPGYIIISTDRGLCGGLNIALFKCILEHMARQVGGTTQMYPVSVVGKKGFNFFSRVSFTSVIASALNLPAASKFSDLVGCVKGMIDMFVTGKVNVVYLAHNSFVNTMSQKPYLYQLLPIVEEHSSIKKLWDYLYEPSAEELLSILFIRYVESLVYQGFVENQACEQAARMVAMKSATENANEVVERFTLIYNKERQAVITRELSEIVAGAAAV